MNKSFSILTRRQFAWSVAAAFGGLVLPADAFGAGGKPLLKMGVLSDVHIGPDGSDDLLLKELRYLDSQKVEVVLFPGDIANHGLISYHERFAACWNKVFPNCVASDGRRVEHVLVTGNHDLMNKRWEDWWAKYTEEQQAKDRLYYKDNIVKTWDRLYGEKWELVWKREVKGVTFVGAQFESGLDLPIEEFFRTHGREIDPTMPFIYVQHQHPRGTCHGQFAVDEGACDSGRVGRELAAFPNAVAFSGHSHLPITDERMVWQGAYTSIGCGCAGTVSTLGMGKRRANAYWKNRSEYGRLMLPMQTKQQNCSGLVVNLFKDHLLIHRHNFFFDMPVGEDWCVPLPAAVDGPYDFARRARTRKAPEFAANAKITLDWCAKAPEGASWNFKDKKPCWRLGFPCAKAVCGGGRVFDYEIRMSVDGKEVLSRELLAAAFHFPDAKSDEPEMLLLLPGDLPAGKVATCSVTPRNCYGVAGKPLVATLAVKSA